MQFGDNAKYEVPRKWSVWVLLIMGVAGPMWAIFPFKDSMPGWLAPLAIFIGGAVGILMAALKQSNLSPPGDQPTQR